MYQLDRVLTELESGDSQPVIGRAEVLQTSKFPNIESHAQGSRLIDLPTDKQPKLYAFARPLARRVQDVMNSTIKDSEQLNAKLLQLSREDARHRMLLSELRRSLRRSRETQKLLRSELVCLLPLLSSFYHNLARVWHNKDRSLLLGCALNALDNLRFPFCHSLQKRLRAVQQ
ncbi:hypothetical protein D915_002264 [Fasciola hepatica]|uniref:Uncharacterized protein n=1 Tax=Fasciola hepatica TaxID=6192 RepID=A0A2H1CNL8_FASHE|nr:hypothetical protein D915_002264 [Fasciola hepatica]